ncbi:MAG TPA: alpha-1,4-glucan--maltose-1-phosphate maltosyltransferase [Vicinamibacterales bacterium]|nr:alpha-1,4-glucan--maltose-1-phosphate maltosyltransferase [Vicinamibacterales bacterium]
MKPRALHRVVIENVTPQVDEGRFPAKRTVGEEVVVEADAFADGHDVLSVVMLWRRSGTKKWTETLMAPLGNDRWRSAFTVSEYRDYEFTVEAWIDRAGTLQDAIDKKLAAGQDVANERVEATMLPEDSGRSRGTRFPRELRVVVERERARFGAWYEMFPRSAGPDGSRSATFREAEQRLPYVAAMNFDVLYLPPIHPIGSSFRKGRNNALTPEPGDPGSPWAIGSAEGGHKAVEPGLGTTRDFERFVKAARAQGLEIALDIAFQASPDHPYVREHPSWFRHRPDGTIKYAENPPKKYQDIYPFDFESEEWPELWDELRSIFEFWIARGVKIFRVDNPHTKPLPFWVWALAELREAHRDVICLSEAFTRPKIMRYLAKAGFSQSYSYFTWRNTKQDLEEYFTELTGTEVREYMRPNLFVNTPDILHEYLQKGGRPAFQARLVLAATLGASYGIYSGFELGENLPVKPDSEEYLDSEKYQIKARNFDDPSSLAPFIARVNAIRREHSALQYDWQLEFHETDNPELICYSKRAPDGTDPILVVVNLDPFNMQHGNIKLPLATWKLPVDLTLEAHDLLSDETYFWRGEWNYVRLDPQLRSAHILSLSHE